MFVCICNAIRDTELRAAVRQCRGGMDADGIYTSLGRPPQCRQCLADAEDIIRDERSEMAVAAPILPIPAPAPIPALAPIMLAACA